MTSIDSSPLPRSLDIGQSIMHFEILEVFPVGGFGITYRAWDSKLNRQVAIKEYFPQELACRCLQAGEIRVIPVAGREAEFNYRLQQYLDEARILASFNHPNIIKVYDFFEVSGTAYIVMEYAEGQSLKALLAGAGVLSQRQCRQIFEPILEGLVQVHAAGFLHRDIKPDNIYVRESGEPVLIDFGAAREHQQTPDKQKTMTAMVSLGYAPPEQYSRDSKWLGPWSDLYSIGACLYHCVNGNAPEESTERQTHLNEDGFDPLKSAKTSGNNSYGSDFLGLIDSLLQLRVKQRPQTVAQVLLLIDRLQPEPQLGQACQQDLAALLAPAAQVATAGSVVSGSQEVPATQINVESATLITASGNKKSRSFILVLSVSLSLIVLGLLSVGWFVGSSEPAAELNLDTGLSSVKAEPVASNGDDYKLQPEDLFSGAVPVEQSKSTCSQHDHNAGDFPPWQESKAYQSGDKVSHQNLVWSASWWTQSQLPGSEDVWLLHSEVEQSWSEQKVYNGGSEVNYLGRRFRANWWSQGDIPGPSEAWVDIGVSTCA
jgi:serine/threonine protein kinase